MAKKWPEPEEEPSEIAAPEEEPETEPEPEVAPSDDLPYAVGAWKGRPNYECKQCPFASLSLDATLEHIRQRHGPPPAPRAHLLDAHGHEIIREVD